MLAYICRITAAKRSARDAGTTAVEYGLLVASIAAIVIALVFTISTVVERGFNDKCANQTASSSSSSGSNC